MKSYAADIPPHLAPVDELLSQYGRWANASSRGGRMHTMDRQFIREADRHESLAAFMRRREEAANRMPLLPVLEALAVQRALARVPDRERQVLAALYVTRRLPAHVQLQILRIPPSLSQIRHVEGLRLFRDIYAQVVRERVSR